MFYNSFLSVAVTLLSDTNPVTFLCPLTISSLTFSLNLSPQFFFLSPLPWERLNGYLARSYKIFTKNVYLLRSCKTNDYLVRFL